MRNRIFLLMVVILLSVVAARALSEDEYFQELGRLAQTNDTEGLQKLILDNKELSIEFFNSLLLMAQSLSEQEQKEKAIIIASFIAKVFADAGNDSLMKKWTAVTGRTGPISGSAAKAMTQDEYNQEFLRLALANDMDGQRKLILDNKELSIEFFNSILLSAQSVSEQKRKEFTITIAFAIAKVFADAGDDSLMNEWVAVTGRTGPNVGAQTDQCDSLFSQAKEELGNAQYDPALRDFQLSAQCYEKTLGKKSGGYATCLMGIGWVYYDTGNYKKALEFYFSALDIQKEVLGDEHKDTAMSYNNIGEVYHSQGEYGKALEYYSKALDIQLKVLGENHPSTSKSYNNIGAAYYSQGDYGKALEYYQKALNIQLKVSGENHPSTALSYNNIGGVYYFQGDYGKALEYYHKALEIFLKIFGENHPSTALSYSNIGSVYNSQGEYGKALEYCQKALEIKLKVSGESHPSTALSYNSIGYVYYSQGEYGKALEYYQKALDIQLKVLGENHPSTATSYNKIGMVYYSQGEYGKALEYLSKALEIKLKVLGENHPDTANSYNNIGAVYYSQGDYGKALEYHNKALKIRLKVLGEDHPDMAVSYNNIGKVYDSQGEYGKALEYYQKALEIDLKMLGENHPDTAISYNNIGLVYQYQGEYGKALEYHQKALDIRLKVLGGNHAGTADSYNNIGMVYNSQSKFEKALDYYQKALEIYRKVYGEEHPYTATSYNNIGFFYRSQGDYGKALEYCSKALSSLCGGKKEPRAEDCRPEAMTVDVFGSKGLSLASMAKEKDKEERIELLKSAAEAFKQGSRALERLREAIETEESKKLQGANYYEMFPAGVGVFMSLARQTGDKSWLDEAFQFGESGIGRVFLEMLGRSRALVSGDVPAQEIEKLADLKARWKAAKTNLDQETAKPLADQNRERREQLMANFNEAESALDTFENELFSKYPKYAELMRPRVRTLAEIREKVLQPEEAALEFILGEDASYLIFITRDKLLVAELPPAKEIEAKIEEFREYLTDKKSSPPKLRAAAMTLFKTLFGPVKDDLAAVKRLLIIPTGKLYFLPFEALRIEKEKGPREVEQKYLAEEFDIRYAPSLSVLYLSGEESGKVWDQYRQWLGFGDPVYDDPKDNRIKGSESDYEPNPEEKRGLAENVRGGADACLAGEKAEGGWWPRIMGTGQEVEAVGAGFEDKGVAYLGFDAREERFKSLMGDKKTRFRYVHLATHGTVSLGPGSQPAVLFTLKRRKGEEAPDDGYLTMEEVFNMRVESELVVLSACMTGCGKEERGEGVAGLSRAFMFAGTESLVVSLWPVADVETRDFMVDFYGRLKAGEEREQALMEAKRKMIKEKLHPYYWAPFIYIGLP